MGFEFWTGHLIAITLVVIERIEGNRTPLTFIIRRVSQFAIFNVNTAITIVVIYGLPQWNTAISIGTRSVPSCANSIYRRPRPKVIL